MAHDILQKYHKRKTIQKISQRGKENWKKSDSADAHLPTDAAVDSAALLHVADQVFSSSLILFQHSIWPPTQLSTQRFWPGISLKKAMIT